MFETRAACRTCDSTDLAPVLFLGETPLADAILSEQQVGCGEPKFPLTVVFCRDCSLVQILETISPEMLYCQNYPYYSSVSPELMEHTKKNVLSLIESRDLGMDSLVVEVASNDGYLLKHFVKRDIPVLGIDPAEGPARVALENHVNTICAFFNKDLARMLRREGVEADVIIANNVLAHVPDQNNVVEGMRELLKDDGVVVIEVPYVRDLIDRCEFDTIYHEHHCYFSVTALDRLFSRNGLFLNHVEHYPIHGGSLRLFVGRHPDPQESVQGYLRDEAEVGLDSSPYYENFASRVVDIKASLLDMLRGLKECGKSIAAYGAAAKGSTLLNYTGIDGELIDFVVDRSKYKQGHYMPGVHIPIYDPEHLLEARPDYVLILAWNFKEEIMRQQEEYLRQGGQFIVPVPYPTLV
jgi:SAM-dependent methyltransferase